MRLFVMAIKDTASQTFATPFFPPAEQVAIRSVGDLVNAPDRGNQIANHPEDYELYELGFFDDNTGLIVSNAEPRLVARCKDLLKKVN